MNGERALDSHAVPTIEWPPLMWPRIESKEPGQDGVLFGFLFRLIGAIVAVIFSSSMVFVVGAFNGWMLTTSLLGLHFALIAIIVLMAEHFRSRVYERLVTDDEASPRVEDVHPLPETLTLPISTRPEPSLTSRAVDIVASAALLILYAPLIVLIALLIKMDSSGPIFVRTTRIGKGGRHFSLLKFRTMHLEVPRLDIESYQRLDAVDFMLPSDPRVTRVGRFLRRTSLDELPTLLNVLMGHMALVGPRPLLPQEMDMIRREIANRVRVAKPGMISLGTPVYWRLGARGDWESLLLAEIQFHERASGWQKFKLLVRVLLNVFRGAGAI